MVASMSMKGEERGLESARSIGCENSRRPILAEIDSPKMSDTEIEILSQKKALRKTRGPAIGEKQ